MSTPSDLENGSPAMPDVQTSVPAPPVLVAAWLLLVGAAVVRLHRRGELTPARAVTVVAGATYVAAVLAVTLLPMQLALGAYANHVPWYSKVNLVPVLTIDVRTFVLNVVMTVPLGVLAPLVMSVRTPRRAALVGLAFSLVIELVQAISNIVLSSGRTGDVNDLIANTAGTVIGWYLVTRVGSTRLGAKVLPRLSLPGRRPRSSAAHPERLELPTF